MQFPQHAVKRLTLRDRCGLTERLTFPRFIPIEMHSAYQYLYGDRPVLEKNKWQSDLEWLSAAPSHMIPSVEIENYGRYYSTTIYDWKKEDLSGSYPDQFQLKIELSNTGMRYAVLKALRVPAHLQGQGFGSVIVATLVSHLQKTGFDTLMLLAGDRNYIDLNKGYLVFPKMGFECSPIVDLSDSPDKPRLKRLNGFDLHRFPELYDKWKAQGEAISCSLNLRPRSKSLRCFGEYLVSKGIYIPTFH